MPQQYTVNLIKTVEIDAMYFHVLADSPEDAKVIASEKFDKNFKPDFGDMETYPDGVVESIHPDYEWSADLEENEPVAPAVLTKADIEIFEQAEDGYTWFGAKVGSILLATGSGCPQDARVLAETWFSDPQEYLSLNEDEKALLAQAIAIAKAMIANPQETVIVVPNP
ncbi:hypothetical protein FD723_39935 (plasmid) [Nostoc sp. C052]|uniref:hypothetical protein n=1 Tax=Nostoc sp. C052 TaxID=2576902 RepID=UPI0015C310AB|nr:hypothetical protein [Nostoc sp. C052]QLE46384.1 hypothetical protein FD723_39935 [Nostoc sp. C052]